MLKPKALFLGLMAVLVAGFALGSEAIPNWSAPATWTPTASGGVHTMTDVTSPRAFIGITPCRVADTRGNGFTGQYGPPNLFANVNRNFTITGQCGIPSGANAVSFNFAALNVAGNGDMRVFPAGAVLPLVSTLNYNGNTPNIANAAIVPLGSGGAITVRADAVNVDLIIDVNGYYSANPANTGNYFELSNNSFLWSILTINNSTTCGGACGIVGEIASTSSSNPNAVEGDAFGATGISYGVHGNTNSTTSRAAGVAGDDGSTVANRDAGFGFSTGMLGFGRNGVGGLTSTIGGYGVFGVAEATTGAITGEGVLGFSTFGVHALVGSLSCAGCTTLFVDPHPTDATKTINYAALQGNEAGTYFRGTARTVDGYYVINVPEDFRYSTDSEGLTVQLTPVGAPATMYVVSEDLNQIIVQSSADVKFHYLVQGVRPAFKDFKAIQSTPEAFLPAGAESRMPEGWTPWMKQRLIANGTYNADGTVNMETAERVGWAQAWRQQAEKAKAESEANAAAVAARTRRPETP